MGIKETSRRAYEELLTTDFFETRQGIVYSLLQTYPKSTQNEIAEIYKNQGHDPILSHNLQKRFSELERQGLIKATGKRTCRATGRLACEWEADPDNRLISIKPQSKADRIKDLEATIERIAQAKSLKEVREILGLETVNYSPPILRLSSNSIIDLFD